MKVAIYVRVSTDKQELDSQLRPLLTFAKKRGYRIVRVYKDVASGKNGDRVALKKLLQAAYQKEFDAIVVWALDRLSREGMYKTVSLIETLSRNGVEVVSYTEPYLDTTNQLAKDILLAVISALARAEREKISDRTRAGLERVKRNGQRLGRPLIDEMIRESAGRMIRTGAGIREVAKKLGVSKSYVWRLKKGVPKRGIKNGNFAPSGRV